MAASSGNVTSYAVTNYVGELFQVGSNETRLLSAIGGLNGQLRVTNSTTFELSQYWAPSAGAQPTTTENQAIAGITKNYWARTQESNVTQIFLRQVNVSYDKLGNYAYVGGVANIDGTNPVTNEVDAQVMAALKQVAIDFEYCLFNGTYAGVVDADTAVKTRGISNAVSTSSVNAASAALTTTMVNTLIKSMRDNGADLSNIVLYANDTLVQLNNLYGLQDRSRNVGGLTLQMIYTPFGAVMVDYASQVASGEIVAVDVSKVRVAAKEIPGKGLVFVEELGRVGAATGIQCVAHLGVDYGGEHFHGKIYGIAV